MSRFDCCESLSRILYRQSLKQPSRSIIWRRNSQPCCLKVTPVSARLMSHALALKNGRARLFNRLGPVRLDCCGDGRHRRWPGGCWRIIMPGRPFCHQCQRVSQRSLCSIEDRIRTCRTHQSFILHLKSKNIHHGKCCYSFIRLKKWSSTCDSTIGNENFGRTSVKFQNFPAFFEKGYIFEKKTTGSTNEWKTRKYYRTFRNVLKLKARQANWWWPIYLSNAHISKKWYFFIDDFKDLKIDTFIIHKKVFASFSL